MLYGGREIACIQTNGDTLLEKGNQVKAKQ